MIRTFIAVEISPEVRKALTAQISHLKGLFPKINWVKPDNLHLTLKFIGNIPPDDLPDIFAVTQEAVADIAGFSLEVCGAGAFPDLVHPRVVYAECTEGREQATALAEAVETALAPLGYLPDGRKYAPHFTLGRIKNPSDALGIEKHAQELALAHFGVIEVEEVVVFMSELKKHGARHTPMQRIRLSTAHRK